MQININKRKELLIRFLVENGKKHSWSEIAKKFGFSSKSSPRMMWTRYLNNKEKEFDFQDNKDEIKVNSIFDHAPTTEEIEKKHKIDSTKWYMHSVYTKSSKEGWRITALFKRKETNENFTENFLKFLKKYKPTIKKIITQKQTPITKEKGFLVINIQDPHYNKLDLNKNLTTQQHYNNIFDKIKNTVYKAKALYEITKIYYIIGSDHFNSEYTNTTTKGTPQQNENQIFTNVFETICDKEIDIINFLSHNSKELEIIYCGGNHDQYVSWHMIKYLEVFFKDKLQINFDVDMKYTKYHKRGKTVFCTNHGDIQKPEKLVQNFPFEFKEWSNTKYRYVLTGDKHTELSKSIAGVEFYQIPSLSPHQSNWDLKNGYTTAPVRLTSFLFSEETGIKNIFKEVVEHD